MLRLRKLKLQIMLLTKQNIIGPVKYNLPIFLYAWPEWIRDWDKISYRYKPKAQNHQPNTGCQSGHCHIMGHPVTCSRT